MTLPERVTLTERRVPASARTLTLASSATSFLPSAGVTFRRSGPGAAAPRYGWLCGAAAVPASEAALSGWAAISPTPTTAARTRTTAAPMISQRVGIRRRWMGADATGTCDIEQVLRSTPRTAGGVLRDRDQSRWATTESLSAAGRTW